jgi:hypothetical protein
MEITSSDTNHHISPKFCKAFFQPQRDRRLVLGKICSDIQDVSRSTPYVTLCFKEISFYLVQARRLGRSGNTRSRPRWVSLSRLRCRQVRRRFAPWLCLKEAKMGTGRRVPILSGPPQDQAKTGPAGNFLETVGGGPNTQPSRPASMTCMWPVDG